jgi:hypothetical protein
MYDPVFVTGSKSFIMKAHGSQAVGFFCEWDESLCRSPTFSMKSKAAN